MGPWVEEARFRRIGRYETEFNCAVNFTEDYSYPAVRNNNVIRLMNEMELATLMRNIWHCRYWLGHEFTTHRKRYKLGRIEKGVKYQIKGIARPRRIRDAVLMAFEFSGMVEGKAVQGAVKKSRVVQDLEKRMERRYGDPQNPDTQEIIKYLSYLNSAAWVTNIQQQNGKVAVTFKVPPNRRFVHVTEEQLNDGIDLTYHIARKLSSLPPMGPILPIATRDYKITEFVPNGAEIKVTGEIPEGRPSVLIFSGPTISGSTSFHL